MKDLHWCVHVVVVKIINLEIPSRCLGDYVKDDARVARLFFLLEQIMSLFSGVVVDVVVA